jgi:hypothetical protein
VCVDVKHESYKFYVARVLESLNDDSSVFGLLMFKLRERYSVKLRTSGLGDFLLEVVCDSSIKISVVGPGVMPVTNGQNIAEI